MSFRNRSGIICINGIVFVVLCFSFSFAIAQPSIISFTPSSGPVGTSVVISGNNFSSIATDNIVYFGGVRATVTSAFSTSLTVTVPPGSAGDYISVTKDNLTAYSFVPFNITFAGSPPVFSNTSLATPLEPSNGTGPYFIVQSDLDGDNKADLVVANNSAGTVSIHRNTSTAAAISFAARIDLASAGARCVAVGDIDGDGKLDIAVTRPGNARVGVYRNTSTAGSISFAARIDFVTATTPNGVTIADIDYDGKPELAVSNQGSASISIFRNTGSPGIISFDAKLDYTTGSIPYLIMPADIDGDGKTDLVTGNNGVSTISVLRNTSVAGSISFAAKADFPGGVYNFRIADIDNDSKPDIVVTGSGTDVFSVLKNTSTSGNPSFAAKVDFTTLDNPRGIATGDLDGDGKADVVVVNYNSAKMSVYKNTTSGGVVSFATRIDYPTATGDNPQSASVGDIDGDGKPDIIAGNTNFSKLSVYRNKVNEPVISSFTPASSGTGLTVTINGSNFNNVTSVSFGGTNAGSFNVVSSSVIEAVIGTGSSGNVSVTTTYGTASLAGFTYVPIATVSSFNPVTAPTGTQVIITGTNFINASAVSFGGTPAASFSVTSPTSITAVAGAGTTGPISVVTPGGTGTSSGVFTIVNIPLINSITPSSGSTGDAVVLAGSNFSPVAADNVVYFGGAKATITAASVNSIAVSIPAGAGYNPVSVTRDTYTSLSKEAFIYKFPPGYDNGADFIPTSFSRSVNLVTGSYSFPEEVASGDFNNDGKVDMVIVNTNVNTMSVFRNTSTTHTISFAAKQDFSLTTPETVVVADINGDGKLDIVAGYNNLIAVYRNTSSGSAISFAGKVDIGVGDVAKGLAVADLNGDGRPEIVTTLYNNDAVAVYRNVSLGNTISFITYVSIPMGAAQSDVVISDIDGDGKIDIIASCQAPATISILRNTTSNGILSFAAKVDVSLTVVSSLAVSDIDRDGNVDILAAGGTNLYMLRNTSVPGTVSVALAATLATGNGPGNIAVGDINGDGKPDVTVSNFFSNTISVYKNNSSPGNISLSAKVDYNSGLNPAGVSIIDLDADGKNDIAFAANNSLCVFRNKINEPHIFLFTPTSGNAGTVVTITGLNFTGTTAVTIGGVAANNFIINSPASITATVGSISTGALDVKVTNSYGSYSMMGFYSGLTITSITPSSGNVNTAITIAGEHFNNTASDNMVFFGAVKANVNSASSTSLNVNVPVGATYAPVTVTTGAVTASHNYPFTKTHAGGGNPFTASSFAFLPDILTPNIPNFIATGDLDGDGKTDIVMSYVIDPFISYFRNTSSGNTISFASRVDISIGGDPHGVTIGDLNGDGKPEIVVASDQPYVSVFRNTSIPGVISFAAKQDFPGEAFVPVIADIDGDRRPDIVSSATGGFAVIRNTGNAGSLSFESSVWFTSGGSPFGLAVGDFDGDGRKDVAVSSKVSSANPVGKVSVFRNTCLAGAAFTEISFSPSTDYPVGDDPWNIATGDLDGDGKLDIVSCNNYSSSISVLRNTGTPGIVSFASRIDYAAGSTPEGIAIADYDGDGRADIAIAKFGGHNVSLFRNTGIPGTISLEPKFDYAATGETVCLAEGDFDNDSRSDLAVANYSGDALSILQNKVGAVFPVTLQYFGFSCKSKLYLEWKTVTENNVSHFEIEYSANGMDWENAGLVKAKGNSNEVLLYTWNSSANEKGYYRLKTVDMDGKYNISGTISANCNTGSVKIYPQPASREVFCEFNGNTARKLRYELTDNTGRILLQDQKNIPAGITRISINISTLAKGNYFIKIYGDNEVVVKNVIIL
jgi:hypothetical protein